MKSAPESGTLPFLIGAWVSLGACIFLTLLSFLFSQEALKKQIDILDGLISGVIKSDAIPKNIFGIVTKVFNYISMGAFVLGLALLATFASLNIESLTMITNSSGG